MTEKWQVIVTKADQKNPQNGESFIQKEIVDDFPTRGQAENAAEEFRKRYQTVYLKCSDSTVQEAEK